MNKLFAVFKREYLSAVRKKMFIIMTFLLPVFMSAIMVLPGMLMMRGLGEKRVTVLDGTGALHDAFMRGDAKAKAAKDAKAAPSSAKKRAREMSSNLINTEYVDAHAEKTLGEAAKPYLDRLSSDDKSQRLDGVFLIPNDVLSNPDTTMKYYSRSATDFIAQERLSSMTNRAIQKHKLAARGISGEELDRVMKEVNVDSVQLSKTGEQKKGGAQNFFAGFILTALLIIPSFIYGLEIMRGIIQEKTDRVIEVLVSSMSSTQLLVGKILGVAAVGLTQIAVWLVMLGLIGAYGITTAAMAGENVLQLLRPATFVYFFIFFILAYLTYVCIYAIGGAVCNSEKEAQQLIAPITMIMMLSWLMM
ncbi:MAG: ABC transporter permease, partial [Thermoanaerobaculia bacterium]